MVPRVLLVDDDLSLLKALNRILAERYEVVTASSGSAALEILANQDSVACVVSDVKMPNMDGVELVRRISLKWPNLPCIILTGNQNEESQRLSLQAINIYQLLDKPVLGSELISTIEQAIRSEMPGPAACASTYNEGMRV